MFFTVFSSRISPIMKSMFLCFPNNDSNSYNPFSSLLKILIDYALSVIARLTKDSPIEPVPPVIKIRLFVRIDFITYS